MSKLKTESQTTPLPAYHVAISHRQLIMPTSWLYFKGDYHLYYLYRAIDTASSTYAWGHLQTKDLTHWKECPDAIIPKTNEKIFSGSIVVDTKNSSGLSNTSKPPFIAIYTIEHGGHQSLQLSYSLDGGMKWTTHLKNPILDPKKLEFRDPHIFWHEPSSKWIMTVSVPLEFKVQFYASKNLLKWDLLNDFGGHPSFKNKWVQPSLATARVVNQQNVYKWILMVSTEDQFSSVRYFVGDFDDKGFRCDHALDPVFPLDYGKDFFGSRPCNTAPDHRLLAIGWMSNRVYDSSFPTIGWKGMFSLPREIGLAKILDGSFKIIQRPPLESQKNIVLRKEFPKSPFTNELEWDLELTDAMLFELKLDSHKGCTLEFDFGNKTKILLSWDVLKHQICLDRTCKTFAFHSMFNTLDCAPVAMGHTLNVYIYLDRYSIEVFTDEGRIALSSIFVAHQALQRFRIIGKQFAASGIVSNLSA